MSRPQYVSQSKAYRVTTNSFTIDKLPDGKWYQYDIFSPEVKQIRKRLEIIHRLQAVVAPETFHPTALYDGMSILKAPRRLDLPGGGTGKYYVSLTTEKPKAGARGVFEITITQTSGDPIDARDAKEITDLRRVTTKGLTAINLMQMIIRQSFNENTGYFSNRRAYFSRTGSLSIGGGLELFKGFYMAVRPSPGRPLVNIDTAVAVMHKSGDLISVALDFLRLRNVRELEFKAGDRKLRELERHFKKVLINVKTTGKSTKTFRGIELAAGRYRFDKDGVETTIAEHYRQAYNITLRFPDIFGVVISPNSAPFPVIVPAELCFIIEGQFYKKKLPEMFTSQMVKFATSRPKERQKSIEGAAQKYQLAQSIVESGMKISPNPLTIDARVLAPPLVEYGGRDEVTPHDGAWNVVRKNLFTPMPVNFLAAINFCPEIQKGMASNNGPIFGMGDVNNVSMSLDTLMAQAVGQNLKILPEFVLVVFLPQDAAGIRAQVKYWGDIKHGVATQCLRLGKVKRANDQYWNNVALKINIRLGGVNSHASTTPIFKELASVPFIVMGADVGHPGPGVQKPSVTSLVWSTDMHATKYRAVTEIQHPRLEIIEKLKDMVKEALNSFGAKNSVAPQRIIFFRDGVSEGEFEKVEANEIPAINAAIDEAWVEKRVGAPKPKLTFIIVGKRHHTLLFPADASKGDKTGNCPAGTVVDTGITHPAYKDFYLQSHSAIIGTSRSAHYTVIKDEVFADNMAKIQDLAFALCHVYAKATRSISIPAPVYYADLVCARSPFHVDPQNRSMQFDESTSGPFDLGMWESAFRKVNPNLHTRMYFL